jgi:hypothetical protein
MLGRAKWDSWNKQKGSDKVDAKTRYVSALIKVSERDLESELDICELIVDPTQTCPE